MCRLSWNLGASTSCNPQGLSRPVMGLFYLCFTLFVLISRLILSFSQFLSLPRVLFCQFFPYVCSSLVSSFAALFKAQNFVGISRRTLTFRHNSLPPVGQQHTLWRCPKANCPDNLRTDFKSFVVLSFLEAINSTCCFVSFCTLLRCTLQSPEYHLALCF
jgi:hypothetical protein